MRRLNGQYSQSFNRRHDRVGHLLQGRFTGILVERESHLLELARYVVLNPLRAGMVAQAEDYAWSSLESHRRTLGGPLVADPRAASRSIRFAVPLPGVRPGRGRCGVTLDRATGGPARVGGVHRAPGGPSRHEGGASRVPAGGEAGSPRAPRRALPARRHHRPSAPERPDPGAGEVRPIHGSRGRPPPAACTTPRSAGSWEPDGSLRRDEQIQDLTPVRRR